MTETLIIQVTELANAAMTLRRRRNYRSKSEDKKALTLDRTSLNGSYIKSFKMSGISL